MSLTVGVPVSELRERWTSRELFDIAEEWRLQAAEAEAARSGGDRSEGPVTIQPRTPEHEAAAVKAVLGG